MTVTHPPRLAAYIAAHSAERDENGRRLVVRNGYHQPREILASAGAIEVTVPRVNDKRTGPATGEATRKPASEIPAVQPNVPPLQRRRPAANSTTTRPPHSRVRRSTPAIRGASCFTSFPGTRPEYRRTPLWVIGCGDEFFPDRLFPARHGPGLTRR
jgi:hypothetical protein